MSAVFDTGRIFRHAMPPSKRMGFSMSDDYNFPF
jgi:hypothetical protein